jgi:serine/threonine protein phosphatase PrpC
VVSSADHQQPGGWTAIGATARGAMHVKAWLPNQDSHAFRPATEQGEGMILAVADGHGDPRCVRADVGSRLAVEVATACTREYLEATSARPARDTGVAASPERLVRSIVETWRIAVQHHADGHPWQGDELTAIDAPENERRPYGCTLLVAGVRDRVLVLVQIGDGDVLAVGGDGDAHRPIGPARDLVGGETLSLAGEDAVGDASCVELELDDAIRMVLLATDGYANSFDDADWARLVGTDYMRLLQDHGPGWIGEQLPEWVEASAAAAGDDVTVLMAVRG